MFNYYTFTLLEVYLVQINHHTLINNNFINFINFLTKKKKKKKLYAIVL